MAKCPTGWWAPMPDIGHAWDIGIVLSLAWKCTGKLLFGYVCFFLYILVKACMDQEFDSYLSIRCHFEFQPLCKQAGSPNIQGHSGADDTWFAIGFGSPTASKDQISQFYISISSLNDILLLNTVW